MKKMLCLALSLMMLLSISAVAATEQGISEEATMTDEILDSLTMDDYADAYDDLEGVIYSQDLTEDEKNQLAVEKYTEIYYQKLITPAPFSYDYDILPDPDKFLNDKEKAMAKENPLQASTVYNCARIATNKTRSLYNTGNYGGTGNDGGEHNGNADAFRHMMWSALLTKEFSVFGTDFANGRTVAKKWTDAHEGTPGNPAIEKEMDLKNNTIGRNLVTAQLNTNDKIATACKNKVSAGGGYRINKDTNKLIPTNKDGLK